MPRLGIVLGTLPAGPARGTQCSRNGYLSQSLHLCTAYSSSHSLGGLWCGVEQQGLSPGDIPRAQTSCPHSQAAYQLERGCRAPSRRTHVTVKHLVINYTQFFLALQLTALPSSLASSSGADLRSFCKAFCLERFSDPHSLVMLLADIQHETEIELDM